jgi:hypothetical protein
MSDLERLKQYAIEAAKSNPKLTEEISDLYQLCLDSIEEGESKENEISLCRNSIMQLLEI